LVIQHKWLLGPDTVSESASNDDKLEAGVNQAIAARGHFRKDLTLVWAALRIKNSPIAQIEAVVICRGAEPAGFFEPDHTVPIVSEERFRDIRTSHESLRDLWASLIRRPDQERAAARARDVTTGFELAGWEFRFPGIQIAHAR
jgi:hypothetical protein